MKINKAKLLVGTLAVVATAATVGSISGTVAWFQYSTRSTVSYTGASAHCTENLQVRIYDEALVGTNTTTAFFPYSPTSWASSTPSWGKWASDLRMSSITDYIKTKRGSWDSSLNNDAGGWKNSDDDGLYPVTSGELAADAVAENLYRDPIRGYEGTTNWNKATTADYVDLPLQFRVADVNGERDTTTKDYTTFLEKKLYLSDLTIVNGNESNSGKKDISSAIRVAFPEATNVAKDTSGNADTTKRKGTFCNKTTTGDLSVNVYGNLDLNGDGIEDRVYDSDLTDNTNPVRLPYDWEIEANTNIRKAVYGDDTKVAVASPLIKSVAASGNSQAALTLLADDSNPYEIVGNELCTVKGFAKTDTKSETGWTTLVVRIYLEGWQTLNTSVAYAQTTAADATKLLELLQKDTSVTPNKPAAPAGYYKLSNTAGDIYYWDGSALGTSALTGGMDSVAVWNDLEYVASKVNIGMTFAVDAHAAQDE